MPAPHHSIFYRPDAWRPTNSVKTLKTISGKTSASVKNKYESLHGIAVGPDQSSRNFGKKCRLARPQTMPNFVTMRQKMSEISAVENLCSRKWTKVHQNPLGFGTHQYRNATEFGSTPTKMLEISAVKNFCSRKSRPKFIKFGEEVSIGQTPNHAKFCHDPIKRARDIQC